MLVKFPSIEQLTKRFLQAIETGNVRPEHGINSLAINIMEAVLEDERMENFDNAETGKVLAKYVHTKTHDNRTGSGPCQLSDNLQYFNCPQPLPELWADLYSTWNLAFTTGFPDFVYYMPKLLIPSVGAYQNDTGSYIYPRIFALYTFIHWKINWDYFNQYKEIQWAEDSLTKAWGAANKVELQTKVHDTMPNRL